MQLTFEAASSYLLDDINQFRGLLVDAEPKPINRILENSCLKLHLRKTNLLCGRTGCGSNWAFGYFGHVEQGRLKKEAVEAIRRECEKLDYCIGLCLVHSLAGGTGSGLGLRLAEDAVEELDLCLRLTFSVTPHRYGDAPLQSYNSLLTLGRLTQFSESVVLLQNDWLLTQLNCRLPRNRAASSRPTTDSSVMAQMGITVDEMNRLAAEQMMNLLAPCDELARDGDTVQADGVRPVHAEPLALNHSLTALSEARFIRVISETARSLNSKKSSRPLGTLAALIVYRGRLTGLTNPRTRESDDGRSKESPQTGRPTESSLRRLHDYMRPVRWNPSPFDHWYESRPTAVENSVTLAFNSCCITEDLNCLLYRAQMRRNVKAYLHWYEKFGCTQDTFDAAVEQLRDVVRGYEELAP